MENINTTLTQNRNYVKIGTAIIIALLFILSWVIIYYADAIKIEQVKTEVQLRRADSLQSLIELNQELEKERITSNNIVNENNDLARINDSLAAAMNELLVGSRLLASNYKKNVEPVAAGSGAPAVRSANQIKSALRKIEEVDRKTIAKSAQQEQYTVYIQYMPAYKRQAEEVATLLKQDTELKVPPMETIEKTTFNNGVRYFDDNDLEMAQRIKKNLWQAGIKCQLQKINMRTSKRHLEIWLGEKDKAKEATLILEKLNKKRSSR